MKDIREIHIKAIELVKDANILLEAGKKNQYLATIEEAFYLEQEAAMELASKLDSEPTRSVLYRSAANLAYLCGKYSEAEKLIYFALTGKPFEELRAEIIDLQGKIIAQKWATNNLPKEKENLHINYLRQIALNFKIKPKSDKHAGAIVVSYIIDFLKNIQSTYQNFSEVHLRRLFNEADTIGKSPIINLFKQESNLLSVNLQHSSFGISLVSDTQIMNNKDLYSQEYKELKKRIFNEFKDDVIFPDYNNSEFQDIIKKKYSDEERKKIYSPIIPSMIDKTPYNITITNEDFSKDIVVIRTLSNVSKKILSPDINEINEEEDLNLIKKIEQKKGRKHKTISEEQLLQAEFLITISNIQHNNKKVYLREPHKITIYFSEKHYSINDEYFNIYLSSNDYNKILQDYNSQFIENYSKLLLNKDSLGKDDLEILDRFEKNSFIDW